MSASRVELSDMPPRTVALTLAGLFAMLLVVLAAVALLACWLVRGAPQPPKPGAVQAPVPRLLADPVAERQRIEASQQRRLTSGARVPIDQAIRIVAAQGWGEDQPPPDAQATAGDHARQFGTQ